MDVCSAHVVPAVRGDAVGEGGDILLLGKGALDRVQAHHRDAACQLVQDVEDGQRGVEVKMARALA
jgi:hypothetical protein